jgi:hypothetical protein
MTGSATLVIALGAAGYAAYRNCIVGDPAPLVRAYYERATNPRPGDLVVEVTSFLRRFRLDDEPHTAVGRLVSVDRDADVWVIASLSAPDAQPTRWANCEWVAFPADPVQARDFTTCAMSV